MSKVLAVLIVMALTPPAAMEAAWSDGPFHSDCEMTCCAEDSSQHPSADECPCASDCAYGACCSTVLALPAANAIRPCGPRIPAAHPANQIEPVSFSTTPPSPPPKH